MLLLGVLAAQAEGAVAVASDYDLLETEILTGDTATLTFSSLNATYGADYQHLQIRMVTRVSADGGSIAARFNGDTGSNYSTHRLFGTGSSVVSDAFTSYTLIWAGVNTTNVFPTDAFGASVLDILDPFETTKYTTTRALAGRTSDFVPLLSGSWRNTAALTQITLSPNAGSFVSGSRFSIYGLRSA
jgi:hypothetical protein